MNGNKFNARTWANFVNAFDKYQIKITVPDLENIYNERHRYFHTPQHLNEIINFIAADQEHTDTNADANKLHDELVLTAAFHDVVYLPWRNDNEEASAEFFINNVYRHDLSAEKLKVINSVYDNIIATKNHTANTLAQSFFNKYDFGNLNNPNFHDVSYFFEKEKLLFKEYQFSPLDKYIEGRVKFLSGDFKNPHVHEIINYVKNRDYNIAIYPGSFNPFHIGHYKILEKAEQMFDKVIVLMAVNPAKQTHVDTLCLQKLKNQLPDREVTSFVGNIIEEFFVGNKLNPVLIRGLRNANDLLYEENYLAWCKEFHPSLRYSLILCDKEYSHVSSSDLRAIKSDEILKKYVPECYTKNS